LAGAVADGLTVTHRILLATDFYPPFLGGAELQTQLLAQELTHRGHAVTVATVWHHGLAKSEDNAGVSIRRIRGLSMELPWAFSDPGRRRYHPPFPDPIITYELRRLIHRFRPNVVHASGWIAYSARLASATTGVPLALSAWDYGYACPIRTLSLNGRVCSGPTPEKCLRHVADGFGTAKTAAAVGGVLGLRRWLVAGVAGVHVPSRFAGEMAQRDLLPVEKWDLITLIPAMIRPPDGDASLVAGSRELLGRLPAEPFMLFVGALQQHKGIGPLLSAYERLSSPPPLVMVGTSWPDTPGEWPSRVTVLTDVPNSIVREIWRRSMFGILPSLVPETFGAVVTEAMQCGRPMIATSIGGPLDTVQPGETGLLVPPGDVAALMSAMQTLIDDSALRQRMGALARERVQERFSPDVVIPQYDAFYTRISSRTAGGR
jgi:glycosyltransferase involved in cell wall biosynthesis